MYDSFHAELLKLAEETAREKVMQGAVTARPWAKRFVASAIPSAVAANFLLPLGDTRLKRGLVAGAGLLGGGAGVGDLALKRWAEKNPRKGLARQIKKQGSVTDAFLKVAAMATDLREKGIGGVNRPPLVTEDSKSTAYNKLQQSQTPGLFQASSKARHLRAPGPSIQQQAAIPKTAGAWD